MPSTLLIKEVDSEFVKECVIKSGLNYTKFAREIGYSPSHFANCIRYGYMTEEMVNGIAKFSDVDSSDIFITGSNKSSNKSRMTRKINADTIKEYLSYYGLTYAEFCDRIGYNPVYFRNCLKFKYMSDEMVQCITRYFGIEESDICE